MGRRGNAGVSLGYQCCKRQGCILFEVGRGKSQTLGSPEKRGKLEITFRKLPRKFVVEEAEDV